MKTKMMGMILPVLALIISACDDFGVAKKKGELRWSIEAGFMTKSGEEVPDTNDFILSVKDSGGKILYEGAYGDSPERLEVDEGSYQVSIVSTIFTQPAFDKPLYGDEQLVVVRSGESVTVHLACTLQNSGVRLRTASEFLTTHPDGTLYVSQGEKRLLYAYRETRTAYLFPGAFSLLMHEGGEMRTLLTRDIAPREILTLKISAPETSGGRVEVAVDTSKIWTTEDFVIGGNSSGNSGEDLADAIGVADAASHAGESDVWVYGYIVGGDLSTAGKSVKTTGLSKKTHLALAARSSITEKASCLAVELPQGKVRDALNLVDHPELIGTRVYVKGNIVESYFATTGLKGTSDYVRK